MPFTIVRDGIFYICIAPTTSIMARQKVHIQSVSDEWTFIKPNGGGSWEEGRVGGTRNLPAQTTMAPAGSVQFNYFGTLKSAEGLQLQRQDLEV